MYTTGLLASSLLAATVSAIPLLSACQSGTSSAQSSLAVADALFDGSCFYPKPDDDFELTDYLGRWYQVAGTVAPFTAGCDCIYAEYSLNTNGTVNVLNICEASGQQTLIQGTASLVDVRYDGEDHDGDDDDDDDDDEVIGAFQVQFPGQPAPECPGPNYIVQDYSDSRDSGWAIVQASNFTTLFVLSRQQNPLEAELDAWLTRAAALGTNMTDVERTVQTGCRFTD